jgi:pilus assembly protein CpaE
MSERLLLISSDNAIVASVKAALDAAASLLQIDRLPENCGDLRERFQPNGIIIDSEARVGVQSAFECIAEAKRHFPATPVIALGNEMSAQLVLAALRAGADDFVDRQADADQLQAAICTCMTRQSPAAATGRGRVAAVLSALPSEQDQDFALNLAVRAARSGAGKNVLYLDLSLPVTQAGLALGIAPEFGVGDAVRELARLDGALLEGALARDPRSGLFVMPLAPGIRAEAAMLETAGFSALLQVLRASFDIIVIGFGPFSRQESLLRMLEANSMLFLCCSQRFPSVQGTAGLLRWLGENKFALPSNLVVHELAPGCTPTPADIRKVLNIATSIDLDAGWDRLALHVNDGKPLALTASRYSQSLDDCLARMGLAPPARPDLVSRLRSWMGVAFEGQPA